MATLTIALTGPIDGSNQTVTRTANIPNANILPAVLAFLKNKYATPGDPPIPLTLDADAFQAMVTAFLKHLAAEVRNDAVQKAQIQAQASVPNIDIS